MKDILENLKKKMADGNTSIDRTTVIAAIDEAINDCSKRAGDQSAEESASQDHDTED